MEKYKKVLEKKELYIQFSEEEMREMGWESNQKLSVELTDEGIMLKPFAKIELNLDEWPRSILEMIIQESCNKDVSVNEVINNVLEQYLNHEENSHEL